MKPNCSNFQIDFICIVTNGILIHNITSHLPVVYIYKLCRFKCTFKVIWHLFISHWVVY